MEPPSKRTKLTDHFRVALRPRDLNVPQAKAKSRLSLVDQQAKVQEKQNVTTNASIFNFSTSTAAAAVASLVSTKHKATLNSSISNYKGPPGKADSIPDYDKSLLNNVCWEPHYAWESFVYDRKQEVKFRTRKYLNLQTSPADEVTSTNILRGELTTTIRASITTAPETFEQNQYFTPQRRAELVDWLVEIQMRFSLDHEPLYMAVKLADHYLMNKFVSNEDFILLYMTAMLISVKFDERVPPLTITHLIAVTKAKFGVKYTKRQIISLEVDLLTTLDFNIRFPLSYGFLRRFARCTQSDSRTINLARYILECSLLDYSMIDLLDSEIAAGSLLLAFEMLHLNGAWDETATYYTGYKEQELFPLVIRLNRMLLRLSKKRTAIKRKYSHETFQEVARIPMLPTPLLVSSIL